MTHFENLFFVISPYFEQLHLLKSKKERILKFIDLS